MSYTLLVDNHIKASLKIDYNSTSRLANIEIADEKYTIKKIGKWKKYIGIYEQNGIQIAEIIYEKWYANHYIFNYKGSRYKLVVRNNPLAEWAILQDDNTILAYSLYTENGKVAIKITSNSEKNDLLFDCLLWYLFSPIAQENSGDDLLFLLMLSAS